MTKLKQARKLIAEATPGPWHSDHTGRLFGDAGGGEYESIIRRERICCGSNTALIVAAVNEYAALLDVVEAAQGIHVKTDRDGNPVIIGMLELSNAVRKWEET